MAIKVNLIDIHNRETSLRMVTNEATIMSNNLYDRALESSSSAIIENAIQNWRSLDPNEYRAFNKALELFEHSIDVCTVGQITKYGNLLTEATIKLRDGAQTAAYIKRKLSRFKTKITSKTTNKLKNIGELNKAKLSKNIKASVSKERVAEECFNNMIDRACVYEQCDRISYNNNKISKRYNLDKVAYYSNSVEDFVNEVCELVDTYSFPYYGKFSVAIENSIYTLYKNHYEFTIQEVAETATTYFLMKDDITPQYVAGISKVLKENKLLKGEDLSSLDYIMNPSTDRINECMDNIIDSIAYTSTLESILYTEDGYKDIIEEATKKPSKKRMIELINNFKLAPKKTVEGLKGLIPKFFTFTEGEIIEGIPSFFTILRNFFVLGSFAMGPVVGILTALTSHLITIHMGRSHVPPIIDKYKKELKKVEDKIDKTKDGEKKERLKKYKHELNYNIDKLQKYYDSIRTEKEIEDDWGSDDEDFDFEEAAIDICTISKLCEAIDLSRLFEAVPPIKEIENISDQLLVSYAECISNLVEDTTIKDSIIHKLDDQCFAIRESVDKDGSDYMIIDEINSVKNIINRPYKNEHNDDLMSLVYGLNYVQSMNDLCETAELFKQDFILEDTSFVNKIKLAGEKLKKQAANLSDKEKMMSRTIDGSMESLRRSIEKSLTSDNREAIIKGQVVPSASKIIKMAITGGVAWLINPAIAVIGALGAFALSKKFTKKERQLLLDEINIELEMVEKYLKIAEEKDDMKATRELLQIKKRLEREKSRITYRSRFEYNDHVDTSTADKD